MEFSRLRESPWTQIIFEAIDQYARMGGWFSQLASNIADYAVEKYLGRPVQGTDAVTFRPRSSTDLSIDAFGNFS